MIDTIVLRLHGVDKYSHLIKTLDLKRKTETTSKMGFVDSEELERIQKKGFSVKKTLNILQLHRTGEYLVKTKAGKQVNSSSHYAFTYYVNYSKDFIEFNFSIPKYKYGSNVIMFVKHHREKDFSFVNNSKMGYNIDQVSRMVRPFIFNFFKHEFLSINVDAVDLEINRIDVCFNQIFDSQKDALKYLEYQKKLKKKYARDEDGSLKEYSTSLMYVTKRYSAKIYHKGSEYKKNDLKEHLRINNEKRFEYFRTKDFQAFANRILRYELTIRNAYINYLFKNNLFRKDCPFFKIDYKTYQKVSNVLKRNDDIAKTAGKMNPVKKEFYLRLNPYHKIKREDKLIFKYISKIMEKRTRFMFAVNEEAEQYNSLTVPYSCDYAKFSSAIIQLCLEKLLSFINEFQIHELPDEDRVANLIDSHNRSNSSKLPKAEMLWFYLELKKHGSFSEVGRLSYLSRATLYRYKDRFKKIGISETAISPIEGLSIPKAFVDFNDYHNTLTYKIKLLYGIKIC